MTAKSKTLLISCITAIILLSDMSLYTQTINQQNPVINQEGITFYYHNNHAKKVYLKSNFDHWKLKYPFTKMFSKRRIWDGWWQITLPVKYKEFQFKKGTYSYKLVVDGEFTEDPRNPDKMDDGMGGLISYFKLNKDIINYNVPTNPNKVVGEKNYYRFIFKSYQAKTVYLVGNFNHWNAYSLPMTNKGDGIWEIKLKLPPGKYYYNFVVDGKWMKDPLNTQIIRNVLGRANSIFEVKD